MIFYVEHPFYHTISTTQILRLVGLFSAPTSLVRVQRIATGTVQYRRVIVLSEARRDLNVI